MDTSYGVYNFSCKHVGNCLKGMEQGRRENEKHIRWTRQLWQALQPHSSGGVYVNYLGQETDEGADRVRAAYGASKYERLLALKQEYDPQNMFRMNQNIKP